jgi:hypothetical protein
MMAALRVPATSSSSHLSAFLAVSVEWCTCYLETREKPGIQAWTGTCTDQESVQVTWLPTAQLPPLESIQQHLAYGSAVVVSPIGTSHSVYASLMCVHSDTGSSDMLVTAATYNEPSGVMAKLLSIMVPCVPRAASASPHPSDKSSPSVVAWPAHASQASAEEGHNSTASPALDASSQCTDAAAQYAAQFWQSANNAEAAAWQSQGDSNAAGSGAEQQYGPFDHASMDYNTAMQWQLQQQFAMMQMNGAVVSDDMSSQAGSAQANVDEQQMDLTALDYEVCNTVAL